MAKKSEAADKSIENNADYVLTFGEAIEMLRGKEVELEPAEGEQRAGRQCLTETSSAMAAV